MHRLALRIYSALLRLYPPQFRADYAEELRDVFRLLLAQSPEHGSRLLLHEIRDLPAALVREHLSEGTMQKFVRSHRVGMGLAGMVLTASICAVLSSIGLWGYPFTEPGVDRLAGQIGCVERAAEVDVNPSPAFVSVSLMDQAAVEHQSYLYTSGQREHRDGARVVNSTYPPDRSVAAVSRCLMLSAQDIEPAALKSASDVLSGLDLGLPTPVPVPELALNGYWIEGPAQWPADERLVLLSLSGWIADDSYIYHDVLMRSTDGGQTFTRADHQQFRYGSAGIEFLTYPVLVLLSFSCIGTLSMLGIVAANTIRQVNRRLRPAR